MPWESIFINIRFPLHFTRFVSSCWRYFHLHLEYGGWESLVFHFKNKKIVVNSLHWTFIFLRPEWVSSSEIYRSLLSKRRLGNLFLNIWLKLEERFETGRYSFILLCHRCSICIHLTCFCFVLSIPSSHLCFCFVLSILW